MEGFAEVGLDVGIGGVGLGVGIEVVVDVGGGDTAFAEVGDAVGWEVVGPVD